MKVTVISEFIDVHTNELHKVGDVMDITKERLAEIEKVSKNLVRIEKIKKG